jgi:hypothetical protein
MTNYNNSKIYKIEPIVEHEPNEIYVGSTTKERLCQRMTYHRSAYKHYQKGGKNNYTSFKLFEKYGIENCKIILIEDFPCNTKDELIAREAFYIRSLECINKYIPDRTRQERNKCYYEQNKETIIKKHKENYENIKEKLLEKKKLYYENKKEEIKQKNKEYIQNHREENSQKHKKYYENNKSKILENLKAKISCICGSVICKGDIQKHYRSLKHQNFIDCQKEEPIQS